MTSDEALKLFQQTGALLKGHFILRSGRHSRQFFQCALALQEAAILERLGHALASREFGADTVLAPAMGGLVIGQEIARQLRLRFLFAEKVNGALRLRRGFQLAEGERVLIAEDVVTQGGRVQETIAIVESAGAIVVGIVVLVDRSNGVLPFKYPLKSLVRLNIETFAPNNLPPDLQAIPPIKLGS